jgi:hypothetical protein
MDVELWDAMDAASEQVALMLAANRPEALQYRSASGWNAVPPPATQRRDALSSTHHEAGTLWMGNDPASSVTNESGRFHALTNLYVTGPALLPRIGSPNPMLSGIALVRRLADTVVPTPTPPPLDAGDVALFDGTATGFAGWQLADAEPQFSLSDGVITAESGSNLGLLFFARRTFSDFVLQLQFRITSASDNAGVHVRFRDPRQPVPNAADAAHPFVYDRKAFVAVDTGFEIQIDDLARGNPAMGTADGLDSSRTGAIYGIPTGTGPGKQRYTRPDALVPNAWNELRVEVHGTEYTVTLNGRETARFENDDARRGRSPSTDPASGYIGLQAHTGRVQFRAIRLREDALDATPPSPRRVATEQPTRIPAQPPKPTTSGPSPIQALKAKPPQA